MDFRVGLVLGLGLGALIQPAFAIAGWIVWQHDMRTAHAAR